MAVPFTLCLWKTRAGHCAAAFSSDCDPSSCSSSSQNLQATASHYFAFSMNLSCKTILAAGFVANMAKLIYARTNYIIASHVEAKIVTDGWILFL